MVTKQELLHLYGLIEEVRHDYEESQGESLEDMLDGYEQPDLQPTAIHRSKNEYKDALIAVAGGLSEAMKREQEDASCRKEPYRQAAE